MSRQNNFGAGIALGIGIGTALGAAFHNLAMGVAIGAALGVAIGMVWNIGKNGVAPCGSTKDTPSEPAPPTTLSPRT